MGTGSMGVLGVCVALAPALMMGQAAPSAPAATAPGATAPAAPAQVKLRPAPLQLQSLEPATRADPFPPVNPKFFTADSPTVATVDAYLRALLGWDANRIWRVEGIEKTTAPGLSKVVVYVSDRAANSKVQTAVFFVTPDGKNAIADSNVNPFGEKPYATPGCCCSSGPTGHLPARRARTWSWWSLPICNARTARTRRPR